MRAWWQMWAGHFGADWCQRVTSDGLGISPNDGVIGHGNGQHLDKSYRTSQIRWLQRASWSSLYEDVERMVKVANNNAFGFDLNLMREIQFTEYKAEDEGHYNWHEDLFWKTGDQCHRKLSVVIQLSDPNDYEGGELELEHEPPEAMTLKKQGTVIVFPSFCSHRVTAMTKGVRHSLVGWYEGPKFK